MTTQIIYDNYKSPSPPENLEQYINWLNDHLESIPEKHRSSAYVEIEAGEEYGSPTLYYSIKYTRPETKEEKNARLHKIAADKEKLRLQEIRLLNQLKEKYEAKN